MRTGQSPTEQQRMGPLRRLSPATHTLSLLGCIPALSLPFILPFNLASNGSESLCRTAPLPDARVPVYVQVLVRIYIYSTRMSKLLAVTKDRNFVLITREPRPFVIVGSDKGSLTILVAPRGCFSNSVFFGDSFFSDGWVVWGE